MSFKVYKITYLQNKTIATRYYTIQKKQFKVHNEVTSNTGTTHLQKYLGKKIPCVQNTSWHPSLKSQTIILYIDYVKLGPTPL